MKGSNFIVLIAALFAFLGFVVGSMIGLFFKPEQVIYLGFPGILSIIVFIVIYGKKTKIFEKTLDSLKV